MVKVGGVVWPERFLDSGGNLYEYSRSGWKDLEDGGRYPWRVTYESQTACRSRKWFEPCGDTEYVETEDLAEWGVRASERVAITREEARQIRRTLTASRKQAA